MSAKLDAQELAKKIGTLLKEADADPLVGADALYLAAAQVTVALDLGADNMVQRIGYFFWTRMMEKHKTNERIVERGEYEVLKRKLASMQELLGGSKLS